MKSDQQSRTDAVFEQLFRQFRERILNYVYRLVGDGALAEDLTQQAFVKAYGALSRLPTDANQRAWLYRIATNVCYDHLRRRRLIQWLPLQKWDSPALLQRSPETAASEQDAVQRALLQLPASLRSVLILYSVEEYSTAEIGEMLGISQGAVKTRLCRAREKLRQAYEEEL
jgi:RNA polymerase sigma factor (sigma-70 family)